MNSAAFGVCSLVVQNRQAAFNREEHVFFLRKRRLHGEFRRTERVGGEL